MEELNEPTLPATNYTGEGQSIILTPTLRKEWVQIAKWATAFSVLGFLVFAIVTIGMIVAGVKMYAAFVILLTLSGGESALRAFQMLAGMVMLFVVPFFLVNFFHIVFANAIRGSLESKDQRQFGLAWLNLRNYYRMLGALTIFGMLILGLSIYLLEKNGLLIH